MVTMVLLMMIHAALIGVVVWGLFTPYETYLSEAVAKKSKQGIARGIIAFWTIFLATTVGVFEVMSQLGLPITFD
jgi:uncharacterized membrane protein YwzB